MYLVIPAFLILQQYDLAFPPPLRWDSPHTWRSYPPNGRHFPLVQDNLVNDLLMPTEVTALLGVTTLNQSFWPPLELFRTSQHFNSKWSPANEEWFNRQVR